jgi:hypothetical protein
MTYRLTRSQWKASGEPHGDPGGFGRLQDFIFGGDAPPPPDYTPVANASKESAEIMANLGREQLDEARRQYERNMETAKPVVDAQLDLMRQTREQGDDYFNYMRENQRPVETALKDQALAGTAAEDKAATDAITAKATQLGAQMKADAGAVAARYADGASALRTGADAIGDNLAAKMEAIGAGVKADAAAVGDKAVSGMNKAGGEANTALQGIGQGLDARTAAIAGGVRKYVADNEADLKGDIGLFTSGNRAITARYGDDIQADVDAAVADARAGQASAANVAARTALRYGISPAALSGANAVANAMQLASAANTTRTAATDKYRGIVGAGIGMKQNIFQTGANTVTNAGALEARGAESAADIRKSGALTAADMARQGVLASTTLQGQAISDAARLSGQGATTAAGIKSAALTDATNLSIAGGDKTTAMKQAGTAQEVAALTTGKQMTTADQAKDFAKKMDVAGLYRNLPGASQGAYSLSTGAGNSAVNNTMAPGQALQTGMAAGASTTGQGQQLQLSGLTGVLNAQTSYANNAGGSDMGGFGSLLGGAASLATAAKSAGGWGALITGSSKKIKTDRHPAHPALRGVRNLQIDNWRYKKGVADEGEHTGPYAEDVRREFGDRAAPGGKVVDMISMQGVMLKAIQELDKKVDRVAAVRKGVKRAARGRVIDGEVRRV